MKRLILFIMLLPLAMQVTAMANAPIEDSLTVGPDTKNMLSLSPETEVIQVYNGMFLIEFGQGYSLEEMLVNDWPKETVSYIFLSEKGIPISKTIQDGVVMDSDSILNQRFWELRGENTRILCTLGDEVLAERTIYLLDPEEKCLFTYYDTNIGTYVYVQLFDGSEYLLPLEDFYTIAKTLWDNRTSEGLPVLSEAALKPFSLENSDKSFIDYLPWMAIGVAMAGSAVWLILLIRRRHHEP